MGKKIAIIGTTTSMYDAPYDDKSWEIWGLNGAYTAAKRYDRWFDMHDLECLKKHHKQAYFDFLAQCKDKLMLKEKYKDYPDAKVFPYQELVKKYGRYFSNTVAWLTAYAIEQKPEEIGIWGVNMAQDTEYAHQRPCCEYFLGIAEGKGIKVTIPDASELLKYNRLYGIDHLNPIMVKLPDKENEIQANLLNVNLELEDNKSHLSFVNGYAQAVKETIEFVYKKISSEDAKKEVKEFEEEKYEGTKADASKCNKLITSLIEKRSYLQGALSYNQYLKVNWS